MAERSVTCIVIVCDSCGTAATASVDVDDTVHFDDLAEATRHLSEVVDDSNQWTMTSTEHVCPNCRRARVCAQHGHDWSNWWNIDVRGLLTAHRECLRCDEEQMAPAIPAP